MGDRRRLGLGAWLSITWLVLLVVVSFTASSFTADPIRNERGRVIEACGDGSGLPLYDPQRCLDLDAKRAQRTGKGADQFRHLFGVDGAGRDTFSQVVHGTRNTLLIATASIAIATFFGGSLGLLSGYFRRRTGPAIDAVFDIMLAFPPLILGMLIVTYFAADSPDRRVPGIIFASAAVATPIIGRICRASTITSASRDYVTVARMVGASHTRIVLREILPNVAASMMSIALLGVGVVITTEAGLALIGLGVPVGDVSWGSVLAAGSADFANYQGLVFLPAFAIVVTVVALNLLGDAIRTRFDPEDHQL